MSQNISIHLPDDTLVEIDKLSPQGDLSLFISEAIQFYIREAKKKALRDLIEEGAVVRAERDLALAQEWFALDEEV
jgi:CopG family transcriptional regulator / antitoxin EndoAI